MGFGRGSVAGPVFESMECVGVTGFTWQCGCRAEDKTELQHTCGNQNARAG